MVRKRLLSLLLGIITLIFSASQAQASLLVIEKDGNVVWNVLSLEDSLSLEIPRHSYIEVKEAAKVKPNANSKVTLTKNNEKISLVVSSDNETRELDVSGVTDKLVEIEERPEVQKITIGVSDNMFILEQKGIKASTNFPINIDSSSAELSVKTPSGDRFLSILPFQAVETVLRSKLINKVTDNRIQILERGQELQYEVKGEKIFNFYDFYKYTIPVTSYISASTGEVIYFDSPTWFKVLGFLFT